MTSGTAEKATAAPPGSARPVDLEDLHEAWQEPVRGQTVSLGLLRLPGVDVVRSYLTRGAASQAPVARLSGRRLVSVTPGSVVYTLPRSDWYAVHPGRLHPGICAFLSDAALTGAIQSALPARTVCTTAELSMTFCAAVGEGPGVLVASARTIHVDDRKGLAEVFVTVDGVLVAHGTSRAAVQPPIPEAVQLPPPDQPDQANPGEGTPEATPDPYARPLGAHGELTADLAQLSGLETLRAIADGVLPRAPVDRILGVRLVEAERGRVVFDQLAHPWLSNETGTVYGGASAFLAMSAASAAVQSVASSDTHASALDLKVNFFRPIPLDGEAMTATGTLLHRGRHLVIATSEVTHRGRTVAVATGTTALRTREQE
jgi:uncharacterized protein (TIGR00369 family)